MSLELRKSPTLELASAIEKARESGQTVYSLSTPTFHDQSPELFAGKTLKTTLTPEMGLEALRETARDVLFPKWDLPGHECVVTGGAKATIFSVLRASLSPGDRVLIISPHWPTYEDLAKLAHLETSFLATRAVEDFAIDPAALHAALRDSGAKAVVCSNPGNPTGKIYSSGELGQLSSAAKQAGAILIVDESFSNIVFEPDKWWNARCTETDNLFVINSFSKNYHLQGLRLGACLLPGRQVPSVVSVHQTILSAAPTPSQYMALAMTESAAASIDEYAEQRRLMLEFIAAKGWQHVPTEGTFYVFPRIPNIEAIRKRLEARGVFSLSGEVFGEGYGDHTRICFGKPEAEVRAMLAIMEDIIDSEHGEVA